MSATATSNPRRVEDSDSSTETVRPSQEHDPRVPVELTRAVTDQKRSLVARLATADGTAYTTSYLPGTEERTTGRLAGIRRLLEETELAVSRIDDGTYGICQGCLEAISFVRLEILPHTRYCLTCQQRQDAERR